MSSRDLVEKHNVHLEREGAPPRTRTMNLNLYMLAEVPRCGEGPERQLVAPKQVISVARVCKGLGCNSQVTCESGCDHFQ